MPLSELRQGTSGRRYIGGPPGPCRTCPYGYEDALFRNIHPANGGEPGRRSRPAHFLTSRVHHQRLGYQYSRKAVVTLLQLNQPRYWSGGGWAVRCPNATRGMRGEILPLERSGPPGQMPAWLPPGQAPGNPGNRAREGGLGRGFSESSPGGQDRPSRLKFPHDQGKHPCPAQVVYFFHRPKVKNPLQNRAISAFLDSSLACCKALYLRSTCFSLVASSQGSVSGGRVR